MTDFTEQAQEWLEEYAKETFPPWTEAIELLSAALTAAYEQGLEDAATVCDKALGTEFDHPAFWIGKAIRNLKPGEPT